MHPTLTSPAYKQAAAHIRAVIRPGEYLDWQDVRWLYRGPDALHPTGLLVRLADHAITPDESAWAAGLPTPGDKLAPAIVDSATKS